MEDGEAVGRAGQFSKMASTGTNQRRAVGASLLAGNARSLPHVSELLAGFKPRSRLVLNFCVILGVKGFWKTAKALFKMAKMAYF